MGKQLISKHHNNMDWHANCLNTVRLIAAISVMYGHAKVHLNVDTPTILAYLRSFFAGVPVFFTMSGFLLWNSVGRSNGFVHYAKKRFLRIYPELWCAVAVEIIAILFFFDQAIQWRELILFAIAQGTFLQFWTPDFLSLYGCGTPNGSLWTVCVTIQFYIVVYFAYRLLHGRKIHSWLIALVCTVLLSVFSPFLSNYLPVVVYKLYSQTLFPYFWLFLLGAFVAEYRDAIVPFLRRYWSILLLGAALLLVLNWDVKSGPYEYGVFRCTLLFAGLLGFAYRFPKFNIKRDISYGIYLYHMTVINVMIILGCSQSIGWLVAAIVISCVIAAVSERVFSRLVVARKQKLSVSVVKG